MKISVEYHPDLKKKLLSDGFTEEALRLASVVIHKKFRIAAHQVYLRALKKPLPDEVEIIVRPNALMNRKKESNFSVSASCKVNENEDAPLVFLLNESLVMDLLKGNAPSDEFIDTVTHEMVHSADAKMIRQTNSFLVELEMEIRGVFGPLDDEEMCRYKGLFLVLDTLNCFRNEGVAMLGTCLLTKVRFEAAFDDFHVFRRIFVRALRQATKQVWEADDHDFKEWVKYKAYEIAPDILVRVLGARGAIDSEMVKRILYGFQTGIYDMTEQEITAILQAAVTLSLPEYVEGLLTCNNRGQTIGYLTEFLKYCGWFQQEAREEVFNAFCKLMSQPFSPVTDFNETMRIILSQPLDEAELDKKCKTFFKHPLGLDLYHNLVGDLKELQSVMRTSENTEKRQAAQWTLTYLFSEKGVVHHNIPLLGRVDDLLVIEKALKIIRGQSLEEFARYLISIAGRPPAYREGTAK